MDFLDPKKRRAQKIRLLVGYVLIAIAIVLATIVLLYQAYGFGVDEGKVIQNGLVFVGSQPSGSSLYVDGVLKDTTNSRLTLPAGTYTMQIKRDGYRTWQRAITVEGGSVERFDYPFLFPSTLTTTAVRNYSAAPSIASQSPDRRWLLVSQASQLDSFDVYDLNSPQQSAVTVTIPANLLTAGTGAQQLSAIAWAGDNRHILLRHTFNKTYEYILLDRQDPGKSLNLTQTLGLNATETPSFQNGKYDHYFIYDSKARTLTTANLSDAAPTPLLQNVLAYKTYGSNVVVYATTQNAPAGEAQIVLYQNGKDYPIRAVTSSANYLLDITQYSGSWYVVAGVPGEDRVYVYQDPAAVLQKHADTVLVPVDVLKVHQPTYVAFSANAQFIMAESANNFAVYDEQYGKDYTYAVHQPFDTAQAHATWMDGDRLTYVSNGVLLAFDYDSANLQKLQPASANYLPFFNPKYAFVDTITQKLANSKTPATATLTSTALLTPADQ